MGLFAPKEANNTPGFYLAIQPVLLVDFFLPAYCSIADFQLFFIYGFPKTDHVFKSVGIYSSDNIYILLISRPFYVGETA